MYPQMTVMSPADAARLQGRSALRHRSWRPFPNLRRWQNQGRAIRGPRWHETPDGKKHIEFQNVKANTPLYLDTWQIEHIERFEGTHMQRALSAELPISLSDVSVPSYDKVRDR